MRFDLGPVMQISLHSTLCNDSKDYLKGLFSPWGRHCISCTSGSNSCGQVRWHWPWRKYQSAWHLTQTFLLTHTSHPVEHSDIDADIPMENPISAWQKSVFHTKSSERHAVSHLCILSVLCLPSARLDSCPHICPRTGSDQDDNVCRNFHWNRKHSPCCTLQTKRKGTSKYSCSFYFHNTDFKSICSIHKWYFKSYLKEYFTTNLFFV